MECRGDAGCSPAPVVTRKSKAIESQRVREIHHVLPDSRLLCHARSVRIAKTGRPVPAQIGSQYSISSFGQRRRDIRPGMRIVREPVEQNNWESLAAFFVADIECR